jgi:tropomyosin 1
MTTNLQQGTLLDVLKKKMRQTKEEMERYKDECEEYNRKHQLEAMRREEVSLKLFLSCFPSGCDDSGSS